MSIDDQLLIEVKTIAAQSGRTLSAVIEDAIRSFMTRRADIGRSVPTLPTISGGGLQPGVDLDDSAALLDLMEGTSADPARR